MKVLLIADLAVLVGIVGAWMWHTRDDSHAAVGNRGLHGSVPPAGQSLPDLASIRGVTPRVPTPAQLRGHRVLLVGTCLDCRSGDVIGGALRRLAHEDLPEDMRIIAAGWGGSPVEWRTKWSLPKRVEVYAAAPGAAAADLAAALRLDPDPQASSGFAYLFDATGRWRSTFPAQLMLPDDITHDVDEIG